MSAEKPKCLKGSQDTGVPRSPAPLICPVGGFWTPTGPLGEELAQKGKGKELAGVLQMGVVWLSRWNLERACAHILGFRFPLGTSMPMGLFLVSYKFMSELRSTSQKKRNSP